jgi:mannosyltransferase
VAQAVASPAPTATAGSRARRDTTLALLLGITAVALALRLPQFGQSLYGDELFAYDEVANRSLAGMWHAVNHGLEVTPPLYFVLAWLTSQFGDPAIWLRLPSLLAGVALVPATYALGAATLGRRAGLVGAAFVALSPHAIFYSVEARPYALLALFVACSTITLLRALDTGSTSWWAAYAVLSALSVSTHLTAVFALGAQALWAAMTRRDSLRPLILANVAAALVIIPWLPRLLRDDVGWLLDLYGPFSWSISEFADEAAHLLVGYPFAKLASIPGVVAVVAFVAALTCLVLAALWSLRRPGRRRGLGARAVLVMIVPAAVIAGLVLDSARSDHDLVSARNAMAGFAFVAVGVGGLVARLPRRAAVPAAAIMALALATGAVTALGTAGQRPRYRDAAAYIEHQARPGDAVVDRSPFDAIGELGRALTLHLAIQLDPALRRIPVRPSGDIAGPAAAAARSAAARDRPVFIVQNFRDSPPLPAAIGSGYRRLDERVFPGLLTVTVARYGRP